MKLQDVLLWLGDAEQTRHRQIGDRSFTLTKNETLTPSEA